MRRLAPRRDSACRRGGPGPARERLAASILEGTRTGRRPIESPAAVKPLIDYAHLQAVDIRVGTIRRVEEVAGSDKLVRLTVGFGDHERSILAGLKEERSDPAEIEGRQALFVVNLEPRKMMGEWSEGMLFDIGYEDGVTPVLAVPEAPVPDGARAG